MPKRQHSSRRRMVIDDNPFQFVADFDKNFPERKSFSLFRKASSSSSSNDHRRRRRHDDETGPTLLSGVDEYAPVEESFPSVTPGHPSSALPAAPRTASCLPTFRANSTEEDPSLPLPLRNSSSTAVSKQKYIPVQDSQPLTREAPSTSAAPLTTAPSSSSSTLMASPLSQLFCERLPDPPHAAIVAHDLRLIDFERAANDRALAKVSSWLLDNDLIDDFLEVSPPEEQSSRLSTSFQRSPSKTTTTTTTRPPSSSVSYSSNRSVDNISVPSQEGFEISMISGMAVETTNRRNNAVFIDQQRRRQQQLDSYMSKFKLVTQQQLNVYTGQLTEGEMYVAERDVVELIGSLQDPNVQGRPRQTLRELSTYVLVTNTTTNNNATDNFFEQKALEEYPHLQRVRHARRNLKKCFQELEYYSEIPMICERLREELREIDDDDDDGRYHRNLMIDPMTLRHVSQDHADLQVCLVETEAALMKRMDEDIVQKQNYHDHRHDKAWLQQRRRNNLNQVHNFMHHRIRMVGEVGDDVRTKIMTGIGRAFDEAMVGHTEALVAMIEAVELYEMTRSTTNGQKSSGQYYNNSNNSSNHSRSSFLRYEAMRSAALKKLFRHFELRGLQVFREVYDETRRREEENDESSFDSFDSSDDDDDSEARVTDNKVANAEVTAILSACDYLTSEIEFVRSTVSPLFPPSWALETLWSICVAQICSEEILNIMGGLHGNELPDMTVTQLLDLVSWVESFRAVLAETCPVIPKLPKKTAVDDKPNLLQALDGTDIDIETAKETLAWANGMLLKVHDLAKDEFLVRTKEQTDAWLDNVYINDHVRVQSGDGRLMTSLCEDVYSLAGVQLRTIRERLTNNSEALVQAVGVIFKNLFEKQIACRNSFLDDFETCCAAANDFVRMIEHCEAVLEELIDECDLTSADTEVLHEQAAVLTGLYFSDAIFAAQKIHLFVFDDVEQAIAGSFFGEEWVEATHNQYALTLVRTVEDFMGDLQIYLDKLMVSKSLDALVRASVIFYVKCIIRKSTSFRVKKRGIWSYNHRALDRMRGDIYVMRQYYESLTPTYPSLARTIENEFQVLDVIHELLSIAADLSASTERDFIILLQKHIKDSTITKYLVGDLWHLVNPMEEKTIYELVDATEHELLQVAPNDEEATVSVLARQTVPGLRMDMELAHLIGKSRSKRKRPGLKTSATERGEIMLNKWHATWEKQAKQKHQSGGGTSMIPEFPIRHGKKLARKSVKLAKHASRSLIKSLDANFK